MSAGLKRKKDNNLLEKVLYETTVFYAKTVNNNTAVKNCFFDKAFLQ
jgi:hypothetical protein